MRDNGRLSHCVPARLRPKLDGNASGANRFANVASARVRKRTDNRKDLVHN
jgi:hypothetical protein